MGLDGWVYLFSTRGVTEPAMLSFTARNLECEFYSKWNIGEAGVSGPDPDRNISPTSLCGADISGPDNDVVVQS